MILAIAILLAQAAAQPISISITNADFESPIALSRATTIPTDGIACGNGEWDSIPGWEVSGSTHGIIAWTCDDGAPHSQVAFLSRATMDQLTSEKARNGLYLLQADIGNWFYSYSGDWNAALYTGVKDAAGTLIISQAPFCTGSGWALGDMQRITVTCPISSGFVNPANNGSIAGQIPDGFVVIHFENGLGNLALGGHAGWPILIDNVSLTFTPTN